MNAKSFSSEVPAAQLEIHSLTNTVEVLPIVNANTMIAFHYTSPKHDVVIDSSDDLTFDINTIGDKPLSYEVKLKSV